ncbi:hypothetical protein D3C79_848040 [compost metagenome]
MASGVVFFCWASSLTLAAVFTTFSGWPSSERPLKLPWASGPQACSWIFSMRQYSMVPSGKVMSFQGSRFTLTMASSQLILARLIWSWLTINGSSQ